MQQAPRRIEILYSLFLDKLQQIPCNLSMAVKATAGCVLGVSITYAFLNPQSSTQSTDQQVLTVAALDKPSNIFQHDFFTYGFSYDLAKIYAQQNNLNFKFKIAPNQETLLHWAKDGKVDLAITSIQHKDSISPKFHAIPVNCGTESFLKDNGLDINLSWIYKKKDSLIHNNVDSFLCHSNNQHTSYYLATFYAQNVLPKSDWYFIQKDLDNRLPLYTKEFKRAAQANRLDWHLLAAIGYQESHLNPKSVSPTGVRGLMMLTQETAKAMGVKNRNNAIESISGGAKYFRKMLDSFIRIPEPDRTWFALAAYNMGPAAVKQIQEELIKQNKNHHSWVNIYAYLHENKANNPRYLQAIQYVSRIRIYFEHIKLSDKSK